MSSLNPNCTDCGLHASATTVCMRGSGPRTAADIEVMVVGGSPSAMEDKRGVPFLGDGGKILRTELNKNNLLDKTYITQLVKCRPPKDRAPTAAEVKACRPYLEQEIAELQPGYVVTTGVLPS